ncbi:MAG TPA: hypothetical protein VGP41_04480 [Candidatus Lustribacter sp.]|jgi:hypothetical protein|nr:hypothetical protein [Candidatus Lustribacter sp.]
MTFALPSGGGYAGTLSIVQQAAVAGTLSIGTSDVAPGGGVPALGTTRAASSERYALDAHAPLLYITVQSTATFTANPLPAFTITLPQAVVFSGASYYVALYDGVRPSVGQQLGFEGPGVLNGTTLTFSGTGTLQFDANTPDVFTLYVASGSAPAPTAAPTPASNPTGATTSPIALGTASMAFTATGAGAAQTTTITENGYAGSFAIANASADSCGSGASAIVAFSPATLPAGGTLTVTPQNAGTCGLTVSDTNGNSAVLSISVTLTGFTTQ